LRHPVKSDPPPDFGRRVSVSKKFFDTLQNFLKLQKSFKKLLDPTRKGTLTVPFHTIPPSESFDWWVYRQPQTRRPISGGGSCLSGYINKLGHAVEGAGAEQAELLFLYQRAEQRDAAPQQGGYDGDLVAVNE